MAKTRLQFRLDDNTPRIDLAVAEQTGASRAVVRGMFDHGCVSLNGAACDEAGRPGRLGDLLVVEFEAERRYKEKPREREHRSFRIAFRPVHRPRSPRRACARDAAVASCA